VNPTEKKQLRAQAHTLKPLILIGQSGLTEAVKAEIQLALDQHELIKIKIRSSNRELRLQISEDICLATSATLIQSIGQIIVIYRKNSKKH